MFWKYHSGAVSHVDTLLEKEGVTLQEILEQEAGVHIHQARPPNWPALMMIDKMMMAFTRIMVLHLIAIGGVNKDALNLGESKQWK